MISIKVRFLISIISCILSLTQAFSASLRGGMGSCRPRLLFVSWSQKENALNFSFIRTELKRTHHNMISPASANSGGTGHDEILMKIYFSLKDGKSREDAVATLQSYIASFPFSAVLPVQPLTYIPREDGNGVDVSFLRKKTMEKGAIDGGMNFLISSSSEDAEEGQIILVAMRNAEGQTVNKVFTEGLVIKSFVSGLYGDEGGRTGLGKDELMDTMSIQKCIHKWM